VLRPAQSKKKKSKKKKSTTATPKVEDEDDSAASPAATGPAKGGKGKKKGGGGTVQPAGDEEMDEVDKALAELKLKWVALCLRRVGRLTKQIRRGLCGCDGRCKRCGVDICRCHGVQVRRDPPRTESSMTQLSFLRQLLSVDPKNLDADAELRRFFGSKVVRVAFGIVIPPPDASTDRGRQTLDPACCARLHPVETQGELSAPDVPRRPGHAGDDRRRGRRGLRAAIIGHDQERGEVVHVRARRRVEGDHKAVPRSCQVAWWVAANQTSCLTGRADRCRPKRAHGAVASVPLARRYPAPDERGVPITVW
jgi:hypothetical protein